MRRITRSLVSFISLHGGWPEGYGALLHRSWAVLREHGPVGAWRVLATFQQRRAELELDGLRIPAPLPIGSTPPLGARPLVTHESAVDVVVCVHNALDDVKACLESVVSHATGPYRLILVDDGSSEDTRAYLQDFATVHGALLRRHDTATGYTRAANAGLRESSAPYVVMLNSDTIVTANWLDRMVMCAESDPSIGLVGPLSNTASWQSIPEIEEDGDWATNDLPVGVDIKSMAQWVAAGSAQVYPRVSFLNGFCLLIKRSVIDTIGLFDDENFGAGYGEENDYCLRAAAAGWQLSVADDVFVFHAQSRSYNHERRKQLSDRAAAVLERKHGKEPIAIGVARTKGDRVLAGVRARSRHFLQRERTIEDGRRRFGGRSVAFVLPVKHIGGGPKVILQEALAMRRMGVDASILNLSGNRTAFESSMTLTGIPVNYVDAVKDIPSAVAGLDAAIATVWPTAYWLPSPESSSAPVLGYYVQDFEPDFYTRESDEYRKALDSYRRLAAGRVFTKTAWNRDSVLNATGVECLVVGPSVDVDLYRPRLRGALFGEQESICVAAMVRPATERRNASGTVRVLSDLHEEFGDRIRIVIFGTNPSDPALDGLRLDFPHVNLGVQSSEGLALLFNEIDVFLDLSTFQAMGLTAMEAMCCGAATVVPLAGGAVEYACVGSEVRALTVDTASERACLAGARILVENAALRSEISRRAIAAMPAYYPERSAYRILAALFSKEADVGIGADMEAAWGSAAL